jgi:hypothetical protein
MENNIITSEQLQMIMGVKQDAIKMLIKENSFPEAVFQINDRALQFRLDALLDWFSFMEGQICQY